MLIILAAIRANGHAVHASHSLRFQHRYYCFFHFTSHFYFVEVEEVSAPELPAKIGILAMGLQTHTHELLEQQLFETKSKLDGSL